MKLVVMGVASTGKSLIGARLAAALSGRFVDSDDLHTQASVARMARGEPLDDMDRWPWLTRVGEALARIDGTVVIACSALKRSYRDRIRQAGPAIFVHLTGPRDVIEARMRERKGHFMPVSLLDSQIATLEPPGQDEDHVTVTLTRPPDRIVAEILARLRTRG